MGKSSKGGPTAMISARAGDMIEVAVYLAENHGCFCKTDEIAKAMGVKRKELCETLRHLVRAGIIDSRRGRDGGYRMLVDPKELTLWDLVEATHSAIGIGMGRVQYGRWRRAKEGMRRALKDVTVQQMIE